MSERRAETTGANPGCFSVPSVFSFRSEVCDACPHMAACQHASHVSLASIADKVDVGALLLEYERFKRSQAGWERGGVVTPTPITLNVVPKRSAPPQRVVRHELTPKQLATLKDQPKKVAQYLERLMKRGLDLKILIAAERGENPFDPVKSRAYHVAFDLLSFGCTKQSLKACFVTEMDWSESAAYSHASIIWRVFVAIGIATEDGAYLKPSPRLGCNNVSHTN